ncbi:MAG: two-component system chemotaxis family response regulator CheY [Rhodospirillaceae bacterium]|nr:MAG: two-component system chemotaxis family response regulator CheY [Rhodospirillaceae bacterium]
MSVDKNMHILIVDDYKTMLRILRNLLKQLGFNNIDEATDGSMALQMLRSASTYGLVSSESTRQPMAAWPCKCCVARPPMDWSVPIGIWSP